jgi:hypothetical protein
VKFVKNKDYMSTTLKYVLFGAVPCGLILGGSIWIVIDSAKYDKEHPIVCETQSAVKEILAIEGAYAILKLENEEKVNYRIRYNQSVKNLHNNSYTSRQVYTVSIKPGDSICLAYGRKK